MTNEHTEYRPSLESRLLWQYGPDRAALIIAGRDPDAQRDLASWKRLCAHGEPVADWNRNAVRVARLAALDLRE